MNRGYIKVWRKIDDSGIMGNADLCQLLLYLMVKASHRPRKIAVGAQVVELQPGELFAGRKQLASALGSTEQRVRTALSSLQKCGIINQQATSRGSIISLINWDKYQNEQPASNQQLTNEQPASNQQLTNEQPASNQQLTTKQELRIKNLRTEEGKKEDSCAEPETGSAPPHAIQPDETPVFLTIPLRGLKGGEFPVTEAMLGEWEIAFPAVDVRQQIRNIRQWNLAHPTQQKTRAGIGKHIVAWLTKEQDKGGRPPQGGKPAQGAKLERTISNMQEWLSMQGVQQ